MHVCKIRIKGTGACFYGDAGEFDGRRGINLRIWCQWLYGRELDGRGLSAPAQQEAGTLLGDVGVGLVADESCLQTVGNF